MLASFRIYKFVFFWVKIRRVEQEEDSEMLFVKLDRKIDFVIFKKFILSEFIFSKTLEFRLIEHRKIENIILIHFIDN